MSDNHADDHEHGHHHHHLRESETFYAARTKALESLFREKGLIGTDTVDRVIRFFEHEMGPFNGAKVVARAWTDPAFKERLLTDANKAIAELGLKDGIEGETSASSRTRRAPTTSYVAPFAPAGRGRSSGCLPTGSRIPCSGRVSVREPRGVLSDFGVSLPDDKQIMVWDSSAQVRYFVIPERPAGTDRMSEEDLSQLVSTEAMQGLELAKG